MLPPLSSARPPPHAREPHNPTAGLSAVVLSAADCSWVDLARRGVRIYMILWAPSVAHFFNPFPDDRSGELKPECGFDSAHLQVPFLLDFF